MQDCPFKKTLYPKRLSPPTLFQHQAAFSVHTSFLHLEPISWSRLSLSHFLPSKTTHLTLLQLFPLTSSFPFSRLSEHRSSVAFQKKIATDHAARVHLLLLYLPLHALLLLSMPYLAPFSRLSEHRYCVIWAQDRPNRVSYGPNIGPTSSEPGTITMRAGGLVAKRREYFETC